MKKFFAVALLAGTIATPAFAQNAPTFQGPRVEAQIGYDSVDVEGESSDGLSYGVALGYDFQRGGAVFGIEAEAADSSADQCVTGVTVATDELCAAAGRDLYIGGRIGAAVSPRVLLYAKAGYTNARVRLDYEDGTAGTVNDFSIGENLDGVRVGAGLEFALSSNAFLRTEYRYSNYEQGFDRHQGVAGIGFRF
jgi:outer membrane immunogenic protein